MDAMAIVLGLLLLGATVLCLACGLYAALLVLLGALVPRRRPQGTCADSELPRIAILIVAHEEERVVEGSVRSLVAQRYPEDRFVVFVVADRCTDGTAERAKSAGALVLERSAGREGKAAAVAFGVEAVLSRSGFDALAIFDADNVADPDFLHAVGQRLAAGARVVQGFVDAKNPGDSWVSGSSALGFWALAALVQQPRERLGLSSPPMGTGFALGTTEARQFLTDAESLTDDVELGARLALSGIRVAYEPKAKVLDEKPAELGTAVAQRHRWMQGRWAVAGRYLPRLLGHALGGDAGLGARVRAMDVAIQLALPSLSFTAVATVMVAATVLILGRVLPAAFARTAFRHPARGVTRSWGSSSTPCRRSASRGSARPLESGSATRCSPRTWLSPRRSR